MKGNFVIIFCFLTGLMSCNSTPESYIKYVEGYWEITDVAKDNKSIKSYSISTAIDYFKINKDLTGFRKKLKPSLNGKFVATKDKSPFILRVVNNELGIHYTVNKRTFTERIEMASKNTLVISNTDGFKYTYKRFEKLKMDI